jgi:predicted RNase H-like HicB family nuclease
MNDVRYELIIYWSERGQAFIAEVPELPACAADGATYQDAVVAVEIVIREWIETAKELGRPIPKPRGRLKKQTRRSRKGETGGSNIIL